MKRRAVEAMKGVVFTGPKRGRGDHDHELVIREPHAKVGELRGTGHETPSLLYLFWHGKKVKKTSHHVFFSNP